MSESNKTALQFNAALMIGAIFAIISSVLNLVLMYTYINSEPSGSMVEPLSSAMSVVGCLVGLIAAPMAVKKYISLSGDDNIKLGDGAVIGLFTAVVSLILGAIISEIWGMIDNNMMAAFYERMLANYQMIPNFPAEQLEVMRDNFADSMSTAGKLKQYGIGLIIAVIINSLSGMVGAKIFGKPSEEL